MDCQNARNGFWVENPGGTKRIAVNTAGISIADIRFPQNHKTSDGILIPESPWRRPWSAD